MTFTPLLKVEKKRFVAKPSCRLSNIKNYFRASNRIIPSRVAIGWNTTRFDPCSAAGHTHFPRSGNQFPPRNRSNDTEKSRRISGCRLLRKWGVNSILRTNRRKICPSFFAVVRNKWPNDNNKAVNWPKPQFAIFKSVNSNRLFGQARSVNQMQIRFGLFRVGELMDLYFSLSHRRRSISRRAAMSV